MKWYRISEQQLREHNIAPNEDDRLVKSETIGDVLETIYNYKDEQQEYSNEKIEKLCQALEDNILYEDYDYMDWVHNSLTIIDDTLY